MPPRRMYKRKSLAKKKRTPVYRSRMSRRSRAPMARVVDTTVQKINPGREKIVRVKKSLYPNAPYFTQTTYGTNGFQIKYDGTAFAVAQVINFDPSGTFGNNSGIITATSTLTGAAGIPEWSSFKALYSYYRVKRIVIKMFANSTSPNGLLDIPPIVYLKYNNEYNAANPTQQSISEEKNFIRKIFTPEHPEFTYSFYPKVVTLYDNVGVFATEARQVKSMGWTDVNTPSQLLGLKLYTYFPADTTTPPTNTLSFDISYELEFKEQS